MSGAMNRHCIYQSKLYHGLDGENNISVKMGQTMHTGFESAYRIALYQRPGADTEETGRYDLAWKRCSSRSECSQ